jgi:arylsulfatase B
MGALPAAVALALVVVAQASRADAVRPHIVFLMADDLGHGNVGWHRRGPDAVPEANTPAMDALVAEGVALERVYSYACCSPTRSSFISGRLPIHVNVLNTDPATFNSSSGEGAGVATHMTGIGEVLARANYTTAVVGKWDVGMATPHHTPAGRGFQQSLIYFHHCNSYWTSTVGSQTDRHCSPDGAMIDLWTNEGAAPPHPPGVYQERMFVDKAQDIMTTYAANATARAAGPLFLFYASHTVHTPMEVPQANLDRFLGIKELSLTGQGYAALVSVLDEVVANLTASLKTTGLWENTLLVFQSDNGGPIYDNTAKNWHNLSTPQCPSVVRPGMTGPDGREPYRSTCLDFGGAASNYPLRGGKFSNFEGGVRVASFMSGGFIAAGMRGTTSHALIATADWLMTFASLAGVDAKDARAEEYGLPPIDSVDQSGVILGTAAAGLSLREDLVLVRKTPLFAPFIYKNGHYTKTGSGHT